MYTKIEIPAIKCDQSGCVEMERSDQVGIGESFDKYLKRLGWHIEEKHYHPHEERHYCPYHAAHMNGSIVVSTDEFDVSEEYRQDTRLSFRNGMFCPWKECYDINLSLRDYGSYRVIRAPSKEKPSLVLAFRPMWAVGEE